MNIKSGVRKGARLAQITLILLTIIGALRLEPVMGEEVEGTGEEILGRVRSELQITSYEVFTNKYTYCVGEPVVITISGFFAHTWGAHRWFMIEDEDGNIVLDNSGMGLAVMEPIPGGIYSETWHQTYKLFGEGGIQDPQNGEQVPPGKYYTWYGFDPNSKEYGPAEFEIVECESPLLIIEPPNDPIQIDPVPSIMEAPYDPISIEPSPNITEPPLAEKNDKEINSLVIAPQARASSPSSFQMDPIILLMPVMIVVCAIITSIKNCSLSYKFNNPSEPRIVKCNCMIL